jgi:glycosyltransferase involved in cell wall biosynthesis
MVSIIICTHNRADILSYCLNSFVNQTASQNLFEVIVVDNKSTDSTKQTALSFSKKIRNLRYVFEEQIGLSHARNRGFREAKYEWVSYVDDDAKAYANYVERAIWVINTCAFDCFGGRFFPWYLESKPKWLPNDFGEFPLLQKEIGILTNNKDVAGGVIVFKKAVLFEVNGFPSTLGMSGNVVGYGEENWVQNELRKRSYTIGFDPELKIDHLVASYKFTLKWHFRRQYAKGKASGLLNSGKRNNGFVSVIWALGVTFKECFVNCIKFISKPKYYYQNYLLDSFGYLVRTIGYLKK